jgi:hypothetical protein
MRSLLLRLAARERYAALHRSAQARTISYKDCILNRNVIGP